MDSYEEIRDAQYASMEDEAPVELDGYEVWAKATGRPATILIDGDEVIVR